MDTTTCPECGAPAEVTDRFALESTDGPIEHVRVQCVRRHWFLCSTASLARHRAAVAGRAAPAPRPAAEAAPGPTLPAPRPAEPANGPDDAVSRRGAPRPPRPARRSR
jgi:hypothetical protein